MNKIDEFLKIYWPTFFLGVGILINIFWENSDPILFLLFFLILWTVLVFLLKIKPNASIFIALILVFSLPVFLLFGRLIMLEKLAIWIFTLLSFGTIHSFIVYIIKNVKDNKRKK